GLAMVGLIFYEGISFNTLKLAAIAFLMVASGLVIGHAVARSARRAGVIPWQIDREEIIRLEKENLLEEFMKQK
ncbi:MAG: hypothetical protein Q8M92_01645, partial [Candidatus Subteraquimicrobiales bacterium]|nr:hypothetical protein [Candidatus Subteraquimicrobiales bacterium]